MILSDYGVEMQFEQKYNKIKSLLKNELTEIEKNMCEFYCGIQSLQENLISVVTAPSKKIRPVLNLLYLKMYGAEITKKQIIIQSAVELIHNASLIHDDVIDNSDTRRNVKTLNYSFGNNLAVVMGDYLLTIAIQKLLRLDSKEIFEIFNDSLMCLCKGELNQYIWKFKVPPIENYIEKCKNKTAKLFVAGLKSSAICANLNVESAEKFAELFGIAFQIRDDLSDIIKNESDKPSKSDITNGIYNAPVIYSENIKNSDVGIAKTKELLDNYLRELNLLLETAPNNKFKQELIDLLGILGEL